MDDARQQRRQIGGGMQLAAPQVNSTSPLEEHALAPEAVGQAAIGDRETGHRQHLERQRELRHASRDPEGLLHSRHGRDEQMDRQRSDEGNGDERDEEMPAPPEG